MSRGLSTGIFLAWVAVIAIGMAVGMAFFVGYQLIEFPHASASDLMVGIAYSLVAAAVSGIGALPIAVVACISTCSSCYDKNK